MATYVNDLRLKEIATGDESGTWGTSTNTNLELIAEAFSFGTEAITTNADTHTTTIADGSTDPGRSIYLKYTGTLDSACTITIGPNTVSKLWFIENGTSGSQNIIISQGSGANVTVPAGEVKAIYSDGAGSGAAMVDAFANLKVSDAAQTNITSLGTLTTLTVDDITIDGSTISDGADLTVDVGGDIILDAAGQQIFFTSAGTNVGQIDMGGTDLEIKSLVSNADLFIRGNDDGSEITALTFDMSDAGQATFNSGIQFGGGLTSPSGSNINIFSGDTSASSVINLGTSASTRMTIANDGQVGIGTTTSTAPLNIQSDSSARGIRIIGRDNGTSDEAALTFADNANNTTVDIVTLGNALTFFQGGTENMRLTDAGLLQLGTAIGNSTYAGLFNGVSNVGTGAIIQTRNGDGKKHFMLRGDNNVEYGSVGLSASSGSASLQLQGENTIVFNTNTDTERFRIDGDGDLCIGTTAGFRGSEKVSVVAGTVDCFAGYTHAAFAVARKASFVNTFFLLFEANNGSAIGSITSGGSSVTYNTSSDYRLKENIQPMEDGLERLKQLNPIKFNWKEAGTESEGFLAHEVQTIFPEAVDGEKDGEKIQSMDYGRITPLLVKAIQEQQEQIDALQSKIQSLKGE